MSLLIKGITPEELLRVFEWARIGANNCMIGDGVIVTELPDITEVSSKLLCKYCSCEAWDLDMIVPPCILKIFEGGQNENY